LQQIAIHRAGANWRSKFLATTLLSALQKTLFLQRPAWASGLDTELRDAQKQIWKNPPLPRWANRRSRLLWVDRHPVFRTQTQARNTFNSTPDAARSND